ncbi:MAG: methyltransferase domain-containing protein [Anaerolineales bacterium]|nr:methyltransferase domain-containing protein [Anaerolineales bacterium]
MTQDQPVPAKVYDEETVLSFVGNGQYRDFIASKGDRLPPRMARSLRLMNLGPGMRVLDMGCGRGEIVLHAARQGAEVVGIDYSADCLRLTRRTLEIASERDRDRVTLRQADATALPFDGEVFERVLMLDIVEHIHDWQIGRALREAHRVLSPKGYLVLHTLPNRWALQYGYPLFRLLSRRLPSTPRSDVERSVHINEQDILSLKRSLAEAGFAFEIWLENLTLDQATWQDEKRFTDVRREAYPILRHPLVRAAVSLLMHTPLKLIIANDIYAIAWRADGEKPSILKSRRHTSWLEKAILKIAQTSSGLRSPQWSRGIKVKIAR